MRYLFIDTSRSDVSIAIIEDNLILSSIYEDISNKHSIYAVSYVDEMLKAAKIEPNDIDKILVVTGPGSFTGVRIGVTIAKMYGYLLNKDIIKVSALKAKVIGKEGNCFMSLIDTRNNNYYVGLYDSNYDEIIEEQFMAKDKIDKLIEKYQPLVFEEELPYDLVNIVSYYKDDISINPHALVPDYLKLPQPLEK